MPGHGVDTGVGADPALTHPADPMLGRDQGLADGAGAACQCQSHRTPSWPCTHDTIGAATASRLNELLQAWQQGDPAAFASVMRHANGELQRMAISRLRGADTPSLAAGDRLNEAVLKLMGSTPHRHDRPHFFASAAAAMRSIMDDRARSTDKPGGRWQGVTHTLAQVGEESNAADLLTLDALLPRLETVDARAYQVLPLTCFGGLTREEIAARLELSVPTIDRELKFSRAWWSQQRQRDLEA